MRRVPLCALALALSACAGPRDPREPSEPDVQYGYRPIGDEIRKEEDFDLSSGRRGAPLEAGRLAGVWNGEFSNEITGKRGYLWFRFLPGTGVARAEVVFSPEPVDGQAILAAVPGEAPAVLPMDRVSVTNDRFVGTVEEFHDPTCDCVVTATFRGLIRGNVIEGTWETASTTLPERPVGTWRVVREE